ncbi:NAD-dependent epimerase/dehydratase family protein [Viridibacterium curvum]|uniref:NAD-dependent epimerase/dehydratase family protein n=1 Tax=Viridibacterium curvum TaxID=1101404 RepID=A0ABP9QLL5_9RHOO
MTKVAVAGATSLVGPSLMAGLNRLGVASVALTRNITLHGEHDGIRWCAAGQQGEAPVWVCLMPIWGLPEIFAAMQSAGVRRVVALSSTSADSKRNARSEQDRQLALVLERGEQQLAAWAERNGVEWVVLRTTLIHGDGRDRNVADIARWLSRWRLFPLAGGGRGLRQPLHVADVAEACLRLISRESLPCGVFNLVGGETLSYREMVLRIANAQGRRCIMLPVPCWVLRFSVLLLRVLPRYRHLSPDLADRMNADLVFDGTPLQTLLAWKAGNFVPQQLKLHT